jgi:hypothetical protein
VSIVIKVAWNIRIIDTFETYQGVVASLAERPCE